MSRRGRCSSVDLSSVNSETVRIKCFLRRRKASPPSCQQVCAVHKGLGSPAACLFAEVLNCVVNTQSLVVANAGYKIQYSPCI